MNKSPIHFFKQKVRKSTKSLTRNLKKTDQRIEHWVGEVINWLEEERRYHRERKKEHKHDEEKKYN
jgi:hypothetical protein